MVGSLSRQAAPEHFGFQQLAARIHEYLTKH
jgi:hypothetical protein